MTPEHLLAQRLRHFRERAGLSQHDVARELGMHQPAVWAIEAGARKVTAVDACRFARLYGEQVCELLGGLLDTPPED